jgi:hypothetical protein
MNETAKESPATQKRDPPITNDDQINQGERKLRDLMDRTQALEQRDADFLTVTTT